MTVDELINKLQEYPPTAKLAARSIGNRGKIIVVVEGHEVDPVFQFYILEHVSDGEIDELVKGATA